MKTSDKNSFTHRIVQRNRLLILVLVLMVIYNVVLGTIGLADSRKMTQLAEVTARVIYFGGMIWIVVRIMKNRKLLQSKELLREKLLEEKDEMNRMLYLESGGLVWDIIFVCQLFITLTASVMNMAAFYSSFISLVVIIAVKLGCFALRRMRMG